MLRQSLVSDVVKMIVTDQNCINLSKSSISTAGYCDARVVEDPDFGWVFKQQRAIARTILARARSDGCDLDGLCPRQWCQK